MQTTWAVADNHRSQVPATAAAPTTVSAECWSSFRGPRQGVSPWTNAPTDWDGSSGKGVLWKAPLKIGGVSSPVVWADHVYLTEGSDAERAVLAFDAKTGQQLWRQVVVDGGKGEPLPSVSDSGIAMPTPACDANGVYAVFGTGDLAAFSHDGKLKWQLFLKRPAMGYGYASSPCVTNNLVLLQFDDLADGRVLAVDTATGKIRWEQSRSRGASWCSPIVVSGAGGKPMFIVSASGSITAYDLTGKVLWDEDGPTGEVTPSPAWWEDRVFAVNVGSALMSYKMSGPPEKAWQYNHNLSDTSSPVVTGGLVFMAGSNGKLACLDAVTGEELWTYSNAGCYASLVASGDRVYALSRKGIMQIVAAERTFRLIGTCALGEGSDSTPAFGDGRLYMRGRHSLWCIGAE